MKKIFSVYLRPYIPRMSVGLLIKFTGTIMDLLLPWILSYLIDDIVPRKMCIRDRHQNNTGYADDLYRPAGFYQIYL